MNSSFHFSQTRFHIDFSVLNEDAISILKYSSVIKQQITIYFTIQESERRKKKRLQKGNIKNKVERKTF